jgi:hypothetical protein
LTRTCYAQRDAARELRQACSLVFNKQWRIWCIGAGTHPSGLTDRKLQVPPTRTKRYPPTPTWRTGRRGGGSGSSALRRRPYSARGTSPGTGCCTPAERLTRSTSPPPPPPRNSFLSLSPPPQPSTSPLVLPAAVLLHPTRKRSVPGTSLTARPIRRGQGGIAAPTHVHEQSRCDWTCTTLNASDEVN